MQVYYSNNLIEHVIELHVDSSCNDMFIFSKTTMKIVFHFAKFSQVVIFTYTFFLIFAKFAAKCEVWYLLVIQSEGSQASIS